MRMLERLDPRRHGSLHDEDGNRVHQAPDGPLTTLRHTRHSHVRGTEAGHRQATNHARDTADTGPLSLDQTDTSTAV